MALDLVDAVAAIVLLVSVALFRWRLPAADQRYRQWWAPPLAASFATVIGLVIWNVTGWRPWESVRDALDALGVLGLVSALAAIAPVAIVETFLADSGVGATLRRLGQIINQSLNLSILLLYLPLRAVIGAIAARTLPREPGRLPARWFFGFDRDGTLKLLPHWETSQRLFRFLALIAFALAVLQIGGITARLPLGFGTGWPVLSFLVLAEVAWFLGASLLAARPTEAIVPRAPEPDERSSDFAGLREAYERTWSPWLLASGTLTSRPPIGMSGGTGHGSTELGHAEACTLTAEALDAGESVLLEDVLPHQVETCLKAHLTDLYGRQQRVVVIVSREDQIVDARRWLAGLLEQPGATSERSHVRIDDVAGALAARPDEPPDIVVATHEDEPITLLDSTAHPWATSFAFLLVLDVHASMLWHAPETAALVRAMRDTSGSQPQLLALGDWRVNTIAAVANITGLTPRRIQVETRPAEYHYMVWRADAPPGERGRSFFQSLFREDIKSYVTSETALAYVAAGREGAHALLVQQEGLPWLRSREDAENARRVSQIEQEYRDASIAEVPITPSDWPIPARENGSIAVPIARDTSANLVDVVRKWASIGSATLVHCVAPTYLLRDFFTDRLGALLEHRRSFSALAPDFGDGRRFALYTLFRRLGRGFVPVRDIDDVLSAFQQSEQTVEPTRERWLGRVLVDQLQVRAPEFEYRLSHSFEREAKSHGRFVPRLEMRLHPSTRDEPPEWHRVYTVRGPHPSSGPSTALARFYRGHLDQNILPGQVHAFGGRAYRIERIADATQSVETTLVDLEEYVARYRQHRAYEIDWDNAHVLEADLNSARSATIRLELTRYEASVTRRTLGYYRFESRDGVDLSLGRYVDLSAPDESRTVVERSFPHTDVLRARLIRTDGAHVDDDVRFTLALLLGEMMPSYLPESHQYLGVCVASPILRGPEAPHGDIDPSEAGDMDAPTSAEVETAIARLVPRIDGLPVDQAEDGEGQVTLYFVEDSPFDIGLVAALMRKLDNVVDDLREYLEWYEQATDRAPYLRFGYDRIPSSLRLDEALTYLRPFRGSGPQQFHDVGDPDRRRAEVEQGSFLDVGGDECSFCGRGFEPHALETFDKRLRCVACASEAVDTLRELKALYRHARATFEKRHRVKLAASIEVRFTEAGEILEELGKPVGPVIGGDRRAVGFARDRDGQYCIYLENGHARHNVQATIAHELAHIWQFANLPRSIVDDSELIEGHAVWVEVDYLSYLRYPHLEAYRSAYLALDDVYGVGYRRVMAEMTSQREKDPFALLLRHARGASTRATAHHAAGPGP